MINFALTNCDSLTVLVCASNREIIPGDVRASWVKDTFLDKPNVEVRVYAYNESELPNTSESSREISATWTAVFANLFPDYTLLVTSEPYGDFVAGCMGIQHLAFDPGRKMIPVSATAIRNNVYDNWRYLPESVKSFYAIKVVLLGTESTGKSTLTKNLAEHFACGMVTEAGRDLIDDSNEFVFEDLFAVATEHARRIDRAVIGEYPLIVIDTDIHITKSYAKFMFAKSLAVDDKMYASNKASLYLYLNNDVAYVQDGTRLSEADRNLLDICHRKTLQEHGIELVEISGNWGERFTKAVEQINQLIVEKRVLTM